ncbi:MAG TPA: NAD(P)/FAD-dependent oxidoreductase, partial [Acidimicrobiia bacterium]
IWAAGVQASPLASELAKVTGAALDGAGRIAVLPDLTLPGHPEVFVVGDMMALDDLPGVAEVAIQGGLHASVTILRRIRGEAGATPFKYRDLGTMATIGRFRAVLSAGRLRMSGFPAWLVWCFVHLAFLCNFDSRSSTIVRWAGAMIGRKRYERNFSVGRTAGDVSLPADVRAQVVPSAFPAVTAARAADAHDPEPTKGSQ